MTDHPLYFRHKLNGGIYRWNPHLEARWRIDGDLEPFDPETQDASEAPYSELPDDPRAAESPDPGADQAGQAGGGEPEGEAAPAAKPLTELHWRELKKLVMAKGGVYVTKADAIAFLEANP